MTRICSWCGLILGETCPFCGGRFLLPYASLFLHRLKFTCCHCTRDFRAGTGGSTHTICNACAAAQAVSSARRSGHDT